MKGLLPGNIPSDSITNCFYTKRRDFATFISRTSPSLALGLNNVATSKREWLCHHSTKICYSQMIPASNDIPPSILSNGTLPRPQIQTCPNSSKSGVAWHGRSFPPISQVIPPSGEDLPLHTCQQGEHSKQVHSPPPGPPVGRAGPS